MTPMTMFIIAIAVTVLIGVGIYYGHLQEKKRRENLAAFAHQLGWRFKPDRDSHFSSTVPQFDRFRQGHTRFAHNLMHGSLHVSASDETTVELPVRAGDYHYQVTTSNGKNTTTHTYRFSFLIFDLPKGVDSDLLIRKENIGDKIKAGLGFDDIDFESAEFSDRFYVKSRDKRFAYDVIHPRMMQFLLDQKPPTVMIDGGVLCLTSSDKRWEPREIQSNLDWVKQFFSHWPRHLSLSE